MLIYNYHKNIPEIQGYTCFGIKNEGEKDIAIIGLDVSSGSVMELAILTGEIDTTIPEQDVTSEVINGRLGDSAESGARIFSNPTLIAPTTVIKTATIQDGVQTKVLDRGHGIVIPTGKAVSIRVVPSRVFQDFNATLTFVESEKPMV